MELKAKKKPKFIINIKVFKFTNLQHGILNNLAFVLGKESHHMMINKKLN